MCLDPAGRLALAGLLFLTLSACTGDEAAKRSLVARGDVFVEQKKYAEASIEYRKALQRDPMFAEAYYKLGEAYAAHGDLRNALPAYVRAADLLPDDLELNVKAGNLLLLARRFEDAKTRARAVLGKEPDNVRGLILLGNALVGLQDLDDAVTVARRAVELDPERAGLQGNVAVLELARGRHADAEAAFKKAVQARPGSVQPLHALANFYQTLSRFDDAETALKQALRLDARDLYAAQTLAAVYLQIGRPKEAEQYLRNSVDIAQTPEAWLALADYYLATGRVSEALPPLEKVSATSSGYAAGTVRKAMIAYAHGRSDEAHALLRAVLEKEPKNAAAMTLETRLLLSEERDDEALALVNKAVAADANSAQAYVTLGRVHLARQNFDEARKAFGEALKNDSTRIDAQIELSRLHLARQELDTSIGFAENSIKANPDSVAGRIALVRSLMVRPDDAPRARTELRTLLDRFPRSPDVHTLSGTLSLKGNHYAEARRAFGQALALDADHIDAMSGLAAVDAATNRLADARARVEARIAASGQPKPELLVLAAKVYAASNDPAGTERVLRRLIELDPSTLEGYGLLGQFYLARRQLSQAQAEFAELVKRQPSSVAGHTMIGLLAHASGDLPGAEKAYERAVQLDRRAGAAANNLAWIYATTGRNLPAALELAKSARAQLPRSVEVADTLAFVYYKRNMAGFAIPLLQHCVEVEPKNALYHYHLGLAHALAGEDSKARRSLQQALALNARFEGADDARKVLSQLVY